MNVLITGATGNVGISILKNFSKMNHTLKLLAGVRNSAKDQERLKEFDVTLISFDFENISSFEPALMDIDLLFLLRPPQLADVPKYFVPLINQAKKSGVKHIIFLSVQGVENSNIIPHHKIEKIIVESGIAHTFLRPAYFMQNFTTTLKHDLVSKHLIFLPAGKAKFTLIDLEDVGAVASKVMLNPESHVNKSYALTNNEKLTFGEMANKISKGLGKKIDFKSPNLLSFFIQKKKEDVDTMFILVMIMLHYFPRFQKTPETTAFVKTLTGDEPLSFDEFVNRNKDLLE